MEQNSASRQRLTDLHDPPEDGRVVHGAAVPAPVPELVLALADARLGALADVLHVVLVQLTQLPLALGGAGATLRFWGQR